MTEPFLYAGLATQASFRIVELLPGGLDDQIQCVLHPAEWSESPSYEALSYVWGNPDAKVPILVQGKVSLVTVNLHAALTQLRFQDRSRFIWVDAISINQGDIPERGAQVLQMRKIFGNASSVLVWIGTDNEAGYASIAFEAVRQITDFLCRKLDITVEQLRSTNEIYYEVLFQNQDKVPLISECDIVSKEGWQALLWLYKFPYFTRVWVIQEITANKHRVAHCGHETIDWFFVELVAGYFVLGTESLDGLDFGATYCWWASTAPSELRQARNWLHMLYLASNFGATDSRDVVYGLRGMMHCEEGGDLLNPDYSKSTVEVYRNTVEAALINYKTTSVLSYVSGVEDPSWIPRWDRPMLFRNPFRFGMSVPWRPAGDSQPVWSIDKKDNILILSGLVADSIEDAAAYTQKFFSSAMLSSEEGRRELNQVWQRILQMMAKGNSGTPLNKNLLTSAAVSLSFGLDQTCNLADDQHLLRNFIAYLKTVLDDETYSTFISTEISEEYSGGDGNAFGKPVWDFEYPPASIFITKDKMIGCAIAPTQPGDIVFVPLGGIYPLVLRPHDSRFQIRGFSFVHGIMEGNKSPSTTVVAHIQ